MTQADPHDPRLPAALDLLRRTGAMSVQIRYSDDEEPTVWMAVAEHNVSDAGLPMAAGTEGTHTVYEAAAAMTPADAAVRLAESLLDGVGTCVHCKRPTGVSTDWQNAQPLDKLVCWQVFDPETNKFRRSCEGEHKLGRNDPCFCGSGEKYKRCHGRQAT